MLGFYRNGNYDVFVYEDGTKVRATGADSYEPDFAENIDLKITDSCSAGCVYCHEGSRPGGPHAPVMDMAFIDTLHPYQELAIGGGNVLEHPDLVVFLKKLKEKKVIANITLNQVHFMESLDRVKEMDDEGLFYGLGVSLMDPTEDFIAAVKGFPNTVIHTINGITQVSDYVALADKGLKVLVLGYKDLRRGAEYLEKEREKVLTSQRRLYYALPDLVRRFRVFSFDNLAIEQLEVKRLLSEEEWKKFYMGDDGNFTFYIDAVKGEFAKSSTSPERFVIRNDCGEMFRTIRKEMI